MFSGAEVFVRVIAAYALGMFTIALMQWLEDEWFLIDELFHKIKERIKK